MSKFWDQPQQNLPMRELTPQEVNEAEAVLQSIEDYNNEQEHINTEVEDEEAEMFEVLSNASLRLEQGRLYQLIINHPIFGETDADDRAVRNVTREFRKFARERMEIMLGMRQMKAATKEAVVSSPFNDLEVVALKTIAAQMSKGATRNVDKPMIPELPKKDGITPFSGKTRLGGTADVLASKPAAPKPVAPKAQPTKQTSEVKKTEPQSLLIKPIDQMTPDELLAYESESAKRHNNQKAALPPGYQGIPDNQVLEGVYARNLSNLQSNPGSAAGLISLIQRNK